MELVHGVRPRDFLGISSNHARRNVRAVATVAFVHARRKGGGCVASGG